MATAQPPFSLAPLLDYVLQKRASDLHVVAGIPPVMRLDGMLAPIPGQPILTHELIVGAVMAVIPPDKQKQLDTDLEIDFSFAHNANARFRANVYFQKGTLAGSFRLISTTIPTLKELALPEVLTSFCTLPHGLVLVTGPTGQGKSTTVAAMLNEINETQNVHILSLEDPIEYMFTPKKALISQRELYHDTHSWQVALRSVLREDPNVVFIGEMRDYETIASAITVAETGHLVFATLHTNSASQAIDRMVDVFPEQQQRQVRVQLSLILEAIISQRLLPRTSGGRMAAVEVLTATTAVRNIIREGKTHQLDNVIATSGEVGMLSLEYSLAVLIKSGQISQDAALAVTTKPDELLRLVRR